MEGLCLSLPFCSWALILGQSRGCCTQATFSDDKYSLISGRKWAPLTIKQIAAFWKGFREAIVLICTLPIAIRVVVTGLAWWKNEIGLVGALLGTTPPRPRPSYSPNAQERTQAPQERREPEVGCVLPCSFCLSSFSSQWSSWPSTRGLATSSYCSKPGRRSQGRLSWSLG